MNVTHIFAAGSGFRILDTTERSQTGLLTLEPGEPSSEKPSTHKESDQTLIVLAGELRAEIGDEKATLEDGDAVLVPAKTPHRFTNTGKAAPLLSAFTRGPLFRRIKRVSKAA